MREGGGKGKESGWVGDGLDLAWLDVDAEELLEFRCGERLRVDGEFVG